MKQSPFTNRLSASQEIPRILWNPRVHYCVYKSPPLVPVLSTIRELNCENFILIQVLLNKFNFKFKVWIFILRLIELWSKLLLINIISVKHKCFRNNTLHSWCIRCIPIFNIWNLLLKYRNSRSTYKKSLITHTTSARPILYLSTNFKLNLIWQGRQFPLYIAQLVPQVISFTGIL
jgi:hypothetical protein